MPRIAVIDDSADVRALLCEVLTDDGHDVVAFDGASDVVEPLVKLRPHLVILDVLLTAPGSESDGWELVRQLRGHPALAMTPILVCSGDVVGLREHASEISRADLLDAIEKPFSLAQLEEAVTSLVAGERLPEWIDERDLVLVADRDAHLVHASSAMLDLLGLDADELRHRSVADIVAEGMAWTDREWTRYISEGRWTGPVTLRDVRGARLDAVAHAEIIRTGSSVWHISHIELSRAPGGPDDVSAATL